MPEPIVGQLIAKDQRFAIVASRYNEFIVSKMIEGAMDAFARHGCPADRVTLSWVPGAFELPFTAKLFAESGKFDAVICLGCIVRGHTPHFEFIAAEAAKGIAQVGLDTGVPAIFGIITADSLEQAIERAGTKMGNKGAEAATSAIEMVNLVRQLKAPKKR
jgi:6,7-dimethyl-8-ribityllumazine synthase